MGARQSGRWCVLPSTRFAFLCWSEGYKGRWNALEREPLTQSFEPWSYMRSSPPAAALQVTQEGTNTFHAGNCAPAIPLAPQIRKKGESLAGTQGGTARDSRTAQEGRADHHVAQESEGSTRPLLHSSRPDERSAWYREPGRASVVD